MFDIIALVFNQILYKEMSAVIKKKNRKDAQSIIKYLDGVFDKCASLLDKNLHSHMTLHAWQVVVSNLCSLKPQKSAQQEKFKRIVSVRTCLIFFLTCAVGAKAVFRQSW